jgi:hypothetical protein
LDSLKGKYHSENLGADGKEVLEKRVGGLDGIHLALVNTVMNLSVP